MVNFFQICFIKKFFFIKLKKKQKWLFSTAMQPIRGWRIDSDNVMAHHLQVCPFYERNIRTEPFRICEFDPSILPNHNASSMSTTTTIITK